jgi:hypothetical protein
MNAAFGLAPERRIHAAAKNCVVRPPSAQAGRISGFSNVDDL